MTTYSQTIYANIDGLSKESSWQKLSSLYYLVHQCPGTTLTYTGTVSGLHTQRTVSLTITSPPRLGGETGYPGFYAYGNRVGAYEYLRNASSDASLAASLLFKDGQEMTITCNTFAVYAEGSYQVERHKSRNPGGMFLETGDPSYDAYVASGGIDLTH